MESKEGNEERTVYEERDQMAKRIIELEAELHRMKKDECAKGDEEEEDPSMCSKGTPSVEGVSDDETEDVASDSVPDKAADVVTEVNKEENVGDTRSSDLKVGTPCMLAFETEDTIIAHGTIFDAEGDGENIKVSVDVVLDGQCVIPNPTKEGVTKLTHEVGSHLMWPRHLVLTRNDKKETVGFNTDPSTFSSAAYLRAPVALWCLVRLVEHMGSSIQLNTPLELFGVKRKCCIMVESLRDFSSMQLICTSCLDAYMMYLHTIMVQGRSSSLFKFMDAGSVSYSSYKQSRAQLLNARLLGAEYDQVVLFPYNSGNHWTLVVVNPTKGAAYWIDPLKNRIDGDMSEVLQM
ncbi:uncharacterized protein LOC116404646 isoform X1 [Cucumis sativus]|uniref:uncharacterized protein LOC116404646 isoform X1 n=1 Tax=Cucumis sativus TaxID=3659 RepID=UPI0012F4F4E1|nr:uncharacterized protein LOC116404646 isoform X1 [Cucumis sativus]